MWVKVIAVILFGVIGLGFFCDYLVQDMVYSKTGRAIEHSIDAGIIKSGIVEDAKQGIVRLNPSDLKDATRSEFQRYMNLDSALENKVMKDSQFDLRMEYIDGIPWIDVDFYTHVTFAFPDVKYTVRVNRKIAYESVYK
ncbi:hypothetical protein [Paenibacillus alvei]|uniref:hypothetical protein n=1 Tax=Paenibacillus alvei TaxID=44250 RepID=UPI002280DC4A|nr:hypothetical protein [Paenibacillus alvei]